MSKVLSYRFDCGYEVDYPIQGELTRGNKRTFSLMADLEHNQKCAKCRERQAATELTQLRQEMGLE